MRRYLRVGSARLDRDRQRVGNDLDRIMRDAPRPGTGAESPTVIYTEAFQRNLIYGRTYAEKARALVGRLPARLGADRAPCPHGCDRALDHAILTAPGQRDPALLAKLDAVAGRVLA